MTPQRAKQPGARAAPQPSDGDVLGRLAAGEIGALGELYDRHHTALCRFVSRATCDAEDVDDLVHATFLAAAASAGRYDGRASCRPWLVGIAVQLLRRRRRSFARLIAFLSSAPGARSAANDPRASLEARADIERALRRLSEAKRITVLLAEVEGLACAEIAAMTGVPIGTVWTRLHSARRELRQALGEDGAP